MPSKFLTAALLCVSLTASAPAEVADSAANGFTLKITTNIHAAPAEVYNKFVHNVGDWWNPDHTFSGDSHNLSIEERPMGCFCEKLPTGGIRHLEVLYFVPGKILRMSGGLGPLQGIAGGAMTFQFTPAEGGTKLDLTYVVTGYLPQGMAVWAKPADAMLTEQVTRLKTYVETGKPVATTTK